MENFKFQETNVFVHTFLSITAVKFNTKLENKSNKSDRAHFSCYHSILNRFHISCDEMKCPGSERLCLVQYLQGLKSETLIKIVRLEIRNVNKLASDHNKSSKSEKTLRTKVAKSNCR